MSEGIRVGLVSTYGNGVEEYIAQIWQMLISARNGTFPLQVTGGGSATVPGGADTNVQYNDAGVFGGDSGLTWNKTSKALAISGGTISGSATTPFNSIAGTWNTSGSPIANLVNITNTASGAAARLQSLQIGGVEQVGFGIDGRIFCVGTASFQGIVKGTATADVIATYLSNNNFYYAGGQIVYANGPNTLTLGATGNFTGLIIDSTDNNKNLTISHDNTNAKILTSSGTYVLSALPTSNAGLPSGALYTAAGVVMQVP